MGMIDFNYTDLAPVALFSTSDTGVFVRNDSSWQSVKDMVADAQKRPGKIRFGVGFGTLAHLGAIALEQRAGIKLNIVDTGRGEKNPQPCWAGISTPISNPCRLSPNIWKARPSAASVFSAKTPIRACQE